MIIGHRHRFLFVELPRTGSTAISRELCDHYGGEPVLRKHATYREFLRQATGDEKTYFVFSCVRNPMDKVLSLYYKYRTGHRDYAGKKIYHSSGPAITWLMKKQFRFVQSHNASFSEFFRRFYYLPYDDWSLLDHQRFDYIIRFEALNEGFAEVLRILDVDQKRGLPIKNKTDEKDRDFVSEYSGGLERRAQWVFSNYAERWGYEFPDGWPEPAYTGARDLLHYLLNILRRAYWIYVR